MDATYFTNAAVTTLGAILDREECRKTIVCNACNAIKKMVPASQVAVVLADHYLPQDVKHWDKYTVAKRVFLNEQGERCEEIYHCSFELPLALLIEHVSLALKRTILEFQKNPLRLAVSKNQDMFFP